MLHQIKGKSVPIFAAVLMIIAVLAVAGLLEGSAFAEPSDPGLPPSEMLESFLIMHGHDSYQYRAGTFSQPSNSAPAAGQVFVGKRVEHLTYETEGPAGIDCGSCHIDWTLEEPPSLETTDHPVMDLSNGTIRVTLDVLGAQFKDANGVYQNPLIRLNDESDPYPIYVEIRDKLGAFRLVDELPSGDGYKTRLEGNVLVWEITDPSIFIDTTLEISYTLEPDPDNPVNIVSSSPLQFWTEYWFETGQAQAHFKPDPTNSEYWERVDSEVDAPWVTGALNWNAGHGLNRSWFSDSSFGLYFEFPQNDTPEFSKPFTSTGAPGTGWNYPNYSQTAINNAVSVYSLLPNGNRGSFITRLPWHLDWVAGGPYTITILDIGDEGTIYDHNSGSFSQYTFTLKTNGGFETTSITRRVYDTNWVKKEGEEYDYHWVDDILISDLGNIGKIMLFDNSQLVTFDLVVNKNYNGYTRLADDSLEPWTDVMGFHSRWGQDDDTVHRVRLKAERADGAFQYVAFLPVEDPTGLNFIYEYEGFSEQGTWIDFSVNKPALLQGMRAFFSEDEPINFIAEEYNPWEGNPRSPETQVWFAYDDHPVNDTGLFDAMVADEFGVDTTLTISNQFAHASYGDMELSKSLSGNFANWGVGAKTNFSMKIWDVEGWNGPGSEGGNYLLFRPTPETGPESEWPYGYSPDTLYCVGNMGLDKTGDLDAYLEQFNDFVESGPYLDAGDAVDDWLASPDNPWFWSDPAWAAKVLTGEETVLTELRVSASNAVTVSNLWPGPYQVHEVGVDGKPLDYLFVTSENIWSSTTSYAENSINYRPADYGNVPPDGILRANVNNSYQLGQDNLVITKSLIGPHDHWNVDHDTPFTARVWDEQQENFLLFELLENELDPDYPYYRYVGTSDGVTRTPSGHFTGNINGSTILEEVIIYEGRYTVVLDLLHHDDSTYYVEETNMEDYYSARMLVDGVDITDPDAPRQLHIANEGNEYFVTVSNAFISRQYGRFIFAKHLAGDYEDFGVDNDTPFSFSAYEVDLPEGRTVPRRLMFHYVEGGHGSDFVIDGEIGTHWHFWGLLDEETNDFYEVQFTRTPDEGTNETAIWYDSNGPVWDFAYAGPIEEYKFQDPTGTQCYGEDLTPYVTFSASEAAQICRFVPIDYRLVEGQAAEDGSIDHSADHFISTSITNVSYLESENSLVLTVTNDYGGALSFLGDQTLDIAKSLDGDIETWDVSTTTTFTADVINEDTGNKLAFLPVPEDFIMLLGSKYIYFGELSAGTGKLIDSQGRPIDVGAALAQLPDFLGIDRKLSVDDIVYKVAFSDILGARIENLPKGNYLVAEDVDSAIGLYSVAYRYGIDDESAEEKAVLDGTGIKNLLITNIFVGPGELLIEKELGDNYTDWDILETTGFTAELIDADGNVMLFVSGSTASEYRYAGYLDAGNGNEPVYTSDDFAASANTEITFAKSAPALIKGLPSQAGNSYAIRELDVAAYQAVSYSSGEAEPVDTASTPQSEPFAIAYGEATSIQVTNDYLPLSVDVGSATITKVLEDDFEDFTGVGNATTFNVRVTSSIGREFLFEQGEDIAGASTWTLVGEADSSGQVYLLQWSLPTDGTTAAVPEFISTSKLRADYPGFTADIALSKDSQAKLLGLVPGSYEIIEESQPWAAHEWSCSVTYAGDNKVVAAGSDIEVTVTNTYNSSLFFLEGGVIQINKRLSDNYRDWSINAASIFEGAVYADYGGSEEMIAFVQHSFGVLEGMKYVYFGQYAASGPHKGQLVDGDGEPIRVEDALVTISQVISDATGKEVHLTQADIATTVAFCQNWGATIEGLPLGSYAFEELRVAEPQYVQFFTGSKLIGETLSADDTEARSSSFEVKDGEAFALMVQNSYSARDAEEDLPPDPAPKPPSPKPKPKPSPKKPAPKPAPRQAARRMPRTGDIINMGLWLVLIVTASAGITVLVKKANDSEKAKAEEGSAEKDKDSVEKGKDSVEKDKDEDSAKKGKGEDSKDKEE